MPGRIMLFPSSFVGSKLAIFFFNSEFPHASVASLVDFCNIIGEEFHHRSNEAEFSPKTFRKTMASNENTGADFPSFADAGGNPSSLVPTPFPTCAHTSPAECASCTAYDECAYVDRSSSLMALVFPVRFALITILVLLSVYFISR